MGWMKDKTSKEKEDIKLLSDENIMSEIVKKLNRDTSKDKKDIENIDKKKKLSKNVRKM